MKFAVRSTAPIRMRSGCAVLPIFEAQEQRPSTRAFDRASNGEISRLIKSKDVTGKPGTTHLVAEPGGVGPQRLLLVGCGKLEDFGPKAFLAALAKAGDYLRTAPFKEAVSLLGTDGVSGMSPYYVGRLTAERLTAANYSFTELKSEPDPGGKLTKVILAAKTANQAKALQKGVNHGAGIGVGAGLARDLGNRPANVCTPSHLASIARKLGRDYKGFSVNVMGEPALKKLGMGAMLSVTAGSTEPARFIVVKYQGGKAKEKPIVLVGKGITFDTGGISLKPPPAMDEMKYDMGGAAAVLGALAAVGEIQPKLNVVGLIPACENCPGPDATKPGDIVRSLSGKTIEILNTDAEGRLILCDALTYAERFEPRSVIDMATLTGACVIALGRLRSGLFANDDKLAEALLAAGSRAYDPAWQLPIDKEYGESLKSNFADMANVGSREGSAIIAARFLAEFAKDYSWAHLDIAGSAWLSGEKKGGTGRPVPLLVDYLLAQAA